MSNRKIFISYSHDSREHCEKVLALSDRLREDGIETFLDQYVNGSPQQGWPRWMLDQLDAASFVLLVCTETYYCRFRGREVPNKGKGVDWESSLITQEIYDSRSRTLKFVPVFLYHPIKQEWIPDPLRSINYYDMTLEEEYNGLYDFLLGQAGVEPQPLGTPRTRPRRRGTALMFSDAPSSSAGMGASGAIGDIDGRRSDGSRPSGGLASFPSPAVGAAAVTHGLDDRTGHEELLMVATSAQVEETGNFGIVFTAAIDGREIRAAAPAASLARNLVDASLGGQESGQAGRTLFRLLIPSDLRSVFTSSIRVVLEIDGGTAAMPWELLDPNLDARTIDQRPWAIRSQLLRRFRTESARIRVFDMRPESYVLVIGEPKCPFHYPPMPGAKWEAIAVTQCLVRPGSGIAVDRVRALVDQNDALEITNVLLEQNYRIVHVTGHGEPDANAGVVMSDGNYLGAREFALMEIVPELVFMNCCHLTNARAETAPRAYNRVRFAAAVAQDLIRIGVRCVIAAGLVVDDATAEKFATAFYVALLGGERFVDAVGAARAAAWTADRLSATWAAYQCYGDPDWRFLDPIGSADVPGNQGSS